MKGIPIFAVLLTSSIAVRGQSAPATPLTFEAASVKVAAVGINGVTGGCHGVDSVYSPKQQTEAPPLGRCVIHAARLSHLIGAAYNVSMQNLQAGPDWILRGTLRFDVDAKAADPTKATEQQLRSMLQDLLAERFQLKFHQAENMQNGFALVVAKGGPRLRMSTSEEPGFLFSGPGGEAILKPSPDQPMSLTARKSSVGRLVGLLSAVGTHGPGVDKTGLTGEYDFKLAWDEDAGPSLSTALNEQLGLRMEAEKVPVPIFIVDSAEKPAVN